MVLFNMIVAPDTTKRILSRKKRPKRQHLFFFGGIENMGGEKFRSFLPWPKCSMVPVRLPLAGAQSVSCAAVGQGYLGQNEVDGS